MSFELKPDQSLRKNTRRIARKQLENLLQLLDGEKQSPDEIVHEARKCFKKIRALLRLVRPAIAGKTFRAENVTFRDAARPLTEVRDAKILVETLDKLIGHYHEHVEGRSFGDVRHALGANLDEVRRRVLDEQDAFAGVGVVVHRAGDRVKGWADVPNRWPAVGRGLEATYRQAAAAFAAAAADADVESLHEWRKQAKYLRHQLEILRPVWPRRLEGLADEADRMSELLGDDHDLAVLRQRLTGEPDRFGAAGDREVLVALIDRRRADLEREALELGRRFFRDKPRAFARRIKGYWKAWRAASSQEPSAFA